MNSTKLELSLDDERRLNIISTRRDGSNGIPIVIPLDDLFDNPNGTAEVLLGGAILRHLRVIDPGKFASKSDQIVSDPGEQPISDFWVAQRLIEISLSRRTCIFVTAIGSLLKISAEVDDEARFFMEEKWDSICERISSFSHG